MPPERDPFEPFPAEIPWDTPISDISSWWLQIDSSTGSTTLYPLRLMAARKGWNLTLRTILPLLRDKKTNGPPTRVVLLARGDVVFRKGQAEGKYHLLVGEPVELMG
jgi:hypothetical protein